MKKPSVIAALVIVTFVAGYFFWIKSEARLRESLIYSEEDKITYFSLPDLDGQLVDLKEMVEHNEITWISFGASWCNPCRRMIPTMDEVYSKYKNKGLGMVLISVGEKRETVRRYLNDQPVAFPVLIDSGKVQAQRVNIQELPMSFFVDSTGKIIDISLGLSNLRRWPRSIAYRLGNE